MKSMNLSELGVNSSVYINDSWCNYYKMLWGKCRKLLLKKYISSNVNEVIKTILDFFIQKNSFLNGPKKLIFVLTFKRSQETSFCSYVWKYYYWCGGTTIPLLFACSVLCFCLVASLCFWCFWCFWCVQNLFVKKNK